MAAEECDGPDVVSPFLDNDSVARTRRDRRCLKVLLNRFDVVGCPRGFRDGFVTLRLARPHRGRHRVFGRRAGPPRDSAGVRD